MRAAVHRSQVFGPEFQASEQEERLWGGPGAACPAGSVLNLPFQGRLLPLKQRVKRTPGQATVPRPGHPRGAAARRDTGKQLSPAIAGRTAPEPAA